MTYSEYEQYLLKEWVISQEAIKIGQKTTVVMLGMENGHEVIGTSTCLVPEEYDYEEGVHTATMDALKKVDSIVGYLRNSGSQWF